MVQNTIYDQFMLQYFSRTWVLLFQIFTRIGEQVLEYLLENITASLKVKRGRLCLVLSTYLTWPPLSAHWVSEQLFPLFDDVIFIEFRKLISQLNQLLIRSHQRLVVCRPCDRKNAWSKLKKALECFWLHKTIFCIFWLDKELLLN